MPIMQMNMVYLYCKQKPQGLCNRPCIIRALFMAAIRSGLHKCLKTAICARELVGSAVPNCPFLLFLNDGWLKIRRLFTVP